MCFCANFPTLGARTAKFFAWLGGFMLARRAGAGCNFCVSLYLHLFSLAAEAHRPPSVFLLERLWPNGMVPLEKPFLVVVFANFRHGHLRNGARRSFEGMG